MPEYHFPVPGSDDESKIILFIRRHWASFLGQFFVSLVVLLIPIIIFIGFYFSDFNITDGYIPHFLVLGLSVYYLIAFTVAFVAFISFYYDIYIVTNDFIIDVIQEGYWGRKISQISLLRVQDVSSNIQGFFPTLFAYGDVLVETAGEQTQKFILKSVPNPQEVATKIMQLHNELVETEGRHRQLLEGEGVLVPGIIQKDNNVINKEPPGLEAQPKPILPETVGVSQDQPKLEASNKEEGEIFHSDLDKGGEIDLNNK